MISIKAQTGTAFHLTKGQTLHVRAPSGAQVADLFCFLKNNIKDGLSSGRSIDYNETLRFTQGHTLYSNSGVKMLSIIEDSCGCNDFLVTPCSLQMFRMISENNDYHPSCHENLCKSFSFFDIPDSLITTTFNIFMNYKIKKDGRIQLLEPMNTPTDRMSFFALEYLIVGLTACADEATNAGNPKCIQYKIEPLSLLR